MTTSRVFYSVTEVSAMLGVSRKTVYQLLQSGRLPHIRVSRLIRINVNDLRALSYSYQQAAQEAAAAAEAAEDGDDE